MTQTAVNSAKVLYDLSVDRKDVNDAEDILSLTPVLKEVLECPVVSLDKKEKVIDDIFQKAKLSSVIANFIKEMCKVGNADELSDIFKAYHEYWDEKNHILRATVTSAKEMSQDEIKSIKDDIKKKYPDYTVELSENVDDSLLGGYVVKTKMEEYDKSFTWRLSQLERKMTGRCICWERLAQQISYLYLKKR